MAAPPPASAVPLQLLLVEDSAGDAALVRASLAGAESGRFDIRHVTTLFDALAVAAQEPVDCVLLDLSLPDATGLDTFTEFRVRCPDLPVVVLTGLDDDRVAAQAIAAGAQDWLDKAHIDPYTLRRSIRWAIDRHRTLRDLRRAVEERDTANAALRAAAALKDEFVAIASHELRTPVTILQGFTETLDVHWDRLDAPQAREFVDILVRQTRRLRELVEDLLILARIERGVVTWDLQPVDLATAVEEAVASSAMAGSEHLRVTVPPGLHAVADASHLGRILRNLLDNAVRYGTAPFEVRAGQQGDEVTIDVIDHGEGVPSDFVPVLFDKFTQARPAGRDRAGTGLGLAIAATLASGMGGRVGYRSDMRHGACFTVALPTIAHVPVREGGRETPAAQVGDVARRVLVVDDEPAIRRLISLVLAGAGITAVTEASDRAEAMAQFAIIHPHLVVLDQRLGAEEGLAVAAEILAIRPDQPIALCSGYLDADLAARARTLGITRLVEKGDLHELVDVAGATR